MGFPLAVLHEDSHLIAVDKPAGVLTQGLSGSEPTLEDAVHRHLLDRGEPGAVSPFLGTVHRLDRPVSGVVVWAKTLKAARRLSAQFASRTASKEYWAVSAPSSSFESENQGIWDDWLTPTADTLGVVRVVHPDTARAKRAITRFLLDRSRLDSEGLVLLRLIPETGRTHQLRAQAAAHGLPILGDLPYGSQQPFAKGVALHAVRLDLDHPITKERLEITAPPPATWGNLTTRFDVNLL